MIYIQKRPPKLGGLYDIEATNYLLEFRVCPLYKEIRTIKIMLRIVMTQEDCRYIEKFIFSCYNN